MKKLALLLLSLAMLSFWGCTPSEIANLSEEDLGEISAKIAINIEGVVAEVNGDKITLHSGKTVIINDETTFATQDVWEVVPIDDNIVVGNYIQGFTLDDTSADEVTALVINSNGKNPFEDSMAVFTGVISELNGESAIIVPNVNETHILSSGDKVKANISNYTFAVGDEVVVYYDGDILESYPLTLNISHIELLSDFNATNNEHKD